jgi:hypothetical protein
MRDVIGILMLIIGSAAATKHFALGIPFFIIAVLLLSNGKVSADSFMEIMGPIMIICIVGTILIGIFN